MNTLLVEIVHLKENLDATRKERDSYKMLLAIEWSDRAADLRRHQSERTALINDGKFVHVMQRPQYRH